MIKMVKYVLLIFFAVLIGCSKDDSQDQLPVVVASFDFIQSEVNLNRFQFQNTSTNAIEFRWDFGDGNTSDDVSPVHEYTTVGEFIVTLTAFGTSNEFDTYSSEVTVFSFWQPVHINTWKLAREGHSITFGPNAENPDQWWTLSNDGSRSCMYVQEFKFEENGVFVFDDKNTFWAEALIWGEEDPLYETCFEPSNEHMLVNGVDFSVLGSGEHTYTYDYNGLMTLHGVGAWIGLPTLGSTSANGSELRDSVSFQVQFEVMDKYDLMTVTFDYGDNGYWTARYTSYFDLSEEPDLVE